MADQQSSISSFLPSPRFFNGLFSPKTLTESQISPTSILDLHKNFNTNPLEFNKNRIKTPKLFQESKPASEKFDHEGIRLALIEEQPDCFDETLNKPNTISRKVLFASNLKIQIPSSILSSSGSPESPGDYGIKTRNSQVFSGGSNPVGPTGFGSPRGLSGRLSLSEMELSEEYTRVISHGPNPKTTHIYDNCVVESCCGVIGFGSPEFEKPGPKSPCDKGFLSLCETCNKNLEEGSDIFMYRGEKAFCSEECRCQEMVLDGLMMN